MAGRRQETGESIIIMNNISPSQDNMPDNDSCDISPISEGASLRVQAELLEKIEQITPALKTRILDLRSGSLQQQRGVWLNSSAACPVPNSVITDLELALHKPHVTIDRGTDDRTRDIAELTKTFTKDFCQRYTQGAGSLIFGYNATHVLLALGRALLETRSDLTVAHGGPDHKSSYAFSHLPGWQHRKLIPYSETGFYERFSVQTLPDNSVLLLNALHHMYGTMQGSILAHIPQTTNIVVDVSQALNSMPPDKLLPFMNRANAAVFNVGKSFSPLSVGVLWVRDQKLAETVIECNPELQGSVSSLQIEMLTSTGKFLAQTVDADWYEYIWYLTRYLLAALSQLEHISVIGCNSWQSNTDKLGIVSFNANSMSAQELGVYLNSKGFAVRADGSCTGDKETRQNYDHVRISLLPHITTNDIDALVGVLKECV